VEGPAERRAEIAADLRRTAADRTWIVPCPVYVRHLIVIAPAAPASPAASGHAADPLGGAEVWRDFASYVGYHKGEPVSTAATVIGAGAIGVYNVGTLPGYQRRGFGEAIMRHALEEARREHGISRTILQSSPQGLRLYQRMGYRTVTKVAVYSS
jgi:ribosomal protein S18 acetylase RimI-like enzyme